jgi:hypothetical protein
MDCTQRPGWKSSAPTRAAAEIDPSKPAANLCTVEQTLNHQMQCLRLYILLCSHPTRAETKKRHLRSAPAIAIKPAPG